MNPKNRHKKIIKFSEQQIEFIESACEEKEISFTEMVKRIIDEFITKEKLNQVTQNAQN